MAYWHQTWCMGNLYHFFFTTIFHFLFLSYQYLVVENLVVSFFMLNFCPHNNLKKNLHRVQCSRMITIYLIFWVIALSYFSCFIFCPGNHSKRIWGINLKHYLICINKIKFSQQFIIWALNKRKNVWKLMTQKVKIALVHHDPYIWPSH